MNYSRFLVFNVVGGFAWVSLCMGGGYLLGSQLSDKYFELVLIAIVVVSVLPLVFEWWNHRRKANAASA
jgi:membrane-associated protein